VEGERGNSDNDENAEKSTALNLKLVFVSLQLSLPSLYPTFNYSRCLDVAVFFHMPENRFKSPQEFQLESSFPPVEEEEVSF
jgi:hypothetical protein